MTLNRAQIDAADPTASVWVSASAGSGKTKVLTDRVLNLLLMTGEPERILCLTFTKTAAAEMANRLNNTLKNWAIMPDEALKQALFDLSGEEAEPSKIKRARQLFARTLETKGGLKIMTIHAFCQSVLKRFPIEAGIPPYFDVIDDLQMKYLLNDMLAECLKHPDLERDFDLISRYIDENKLPDLIKMVIDNRDNLIPLIKRFPNTKTVIFELKKKFNIEKYLYENDIISENFNPDEFGSLKSQYLIKSESKIRDTFTDNETAALVFDTLQKINNLKVVQLTESFLNLAYAVLKLYQNKKLTSAALDYDDLIFYTKELLSSDSSWVLYKLDGGIDHILVDESQDTNPNQWFIIRMLANEFFNGIGQSDKIRTIFAVGDKKQSIFSFQGANPDEFEKMRIYFNRKVTDSENTFKTIPLNKSYRSTPAVLELVNRVLENPVAQTGVLNKGEEAVHIAHRADDAGLIEIWPPITPAEQNENTNFLPIRQKQSPSAMTQLAEKITARIKKMISGEVLEATGRPIEPKDILILVQRRNAFMNEMIRCLKEAGIPVAGLDRLKLSDHIAIQDLLALTEFVLLPDDDLNLACVLKSPLFNFSETRLFDLCAHRGNKTLWQQIQLHEQKTAETLKTLLNKADTGAPFEFYAYILSPMNGRKSFVKRLGIEANEALDEFLNLVLNFEQNNTPSLQGFLKFMHTGEIEIKRDLDQNGINAVRLMTVHGSKGLQAPIVFLPDTHFVSKMTETLLFDEAGLPIWIPESGLRTPQSYEPFELFKEKQRQERHRLLYVALTRAADRLYIGGWQGVKKSPEGNWYDLIQDSLPDYPKDSDGVIRITSKQKKGVEVNKHSQVPAHQTVLPDWVYQTPTSEPTPSKPLSPSKQADDIQNESPLSDSQELALKRGSFLHYLLQYLPQIPVDKRRETAFKIKPDNIDIPEQLFTLLESDDFGELFSDKSLPEVPIIGVLNDEVISGKIDRMLVKPDEVIIVDFKTNRQVPSKIPVLYKKQLTTYRELLQNVFPNKKIKTYLLWIQTMQFIEV